MNEITLTIDDKTITALEGEKILAVALAHDIYIPNLCAIRDEAEQPASCRLCFVEVEGRDEPVTACTEPVWEGMVVRTKGPLALRLARTSAELLLASHPLDCGDCLKNRSCQLLRIAKHLGINLKRTRFRRLEQNLPVDDSSGTFVYDPNRCVLCGQCVWMCRERLGIGAIGFTRRGFRRKVSTFQDRPLSETRCTRCGECVKVCPVGAMVLKPSPNPSV